MAEEKIAIFVDTTPKGIKTFTLDADQYELYETGIHEKDGKPVNYFKFKIVTSIAKSK